MATKYFNAAVDNNLDTVGNWWLNEAFTTPAGSKAGAGDEAYIRGSVDSGSINCDYIAMGQSIYITGGTFTSSFIGTFTTGFGDIIVSGGTFNGNVDTSYSSWQFHAAPGCVVNGNVTLQGDEGSNSVSFLYGGQFNGNVTVLKWGRIAVNNDGDDDNFTVTGGIRWGAGSYYEQATTPDYPAETDVRSGVSYADDGMTGTLDLPAEADVHEGTVFDNETKTGTLAASAGGGGPARMRRG